MTPCVLDNGMVVLQAPMAHLQTVSLGVWVRSGARGETHHGISHCLEHMAFKGTTLRNAREIAVAVEDVGGDINAATGHETTAYYMRLLKKDLPLGLEILSDILCHPTFPQEELAREQDVIVQEIGHTKDTPDDLVFDMLLESAYPNQPLGRPILGTESSVRAINRKILLDHRQKHYRGGGMVVAAAGAVQNFNALCQKHFACVPNGSIPSAQKAHWGGTPKFHHRPLEQVHLALGFEGFSHGHPHVFTQALFVTILGTGMSSRLFQEIREKRGLCYSVFSFAWTFADTGLVGVYAATSPQNMQECLHALCGELHRMSENITQEELLRARAQSEAGLLMGLESSSVQASRLARDQMLYGRIRPIQEILDRIHAVTTQDIQNFAQQCLKNPPALAAIGNTLPSYNTVVSKLS